MPNNMLKSVLILAAVFLMSSCGSNHQVASDQDQANEEMVPGADASGNIQDTSFVRFVESIKVISTGYRIASDSIIRIYNLRDSKFLPEGANLMGRLSSTDHRHFILCTYPADIVFPTLEIYDNLGEKIKSIPLFDYSFCSDIDHPERNSEFTVLGNHQVELVNYIKSDGHDSVIRRDTLKLADH